MTPYEALTKEDLTNIKNYIVNYGFMYEPRYDIIAPMEKILGEWNENKINLFNMLGGNLIVRRPYTFAVPKEGIIFNFKSHRDEADCNNFRCDWMYTILSNKNLDTIQVYDKETKTFITLRAAFLTRSFSDLKYELISCFDTESLVDNAWKYKEYKLKFEDGEIFKLSTGMKLMKIFHKLTEKFAPEKLKDFEAFRLWHSRILNNKFLDGEICLSIHPLDYMTMSDNDNNWRSCMRWQGDEGRGDVGDYRAGTVECMNSSTVIVAYLHNPEHIMYLDDEMTKWNSKKWRELFIIDNEGLIINEVKAYPYQDENLTNTILMWIKELAEKNLGFTYDNTEVNVRDLDIKVESEETNRDIMIDFTTEDYMYKDIGTLDKHRGRVNQKKIVDYVIENQDSRKSYYTFNDENGKSWRHYTIDIPYGGIAYCLCCGKNVVEEADRVICSNCDAGYICACCGSTIGHRSEMYYMDDIDNYVCEDCYNYETANDDISEIPFMNYNIISLSWKPGKDYNNKRAWRVGEECYYPSSINVYNGYDNNYYEIFNSEPKYDPKTYTYYVTTDQIIDKEAFASLFYLNKDEIEKYLGVDLKTLVSINQKF